MRNQIVIAASLGATAIGFLVYCSPAPAVYDNSSDAAMPVSCQDSGEGCPCKDKDGTMKPCYEGPLGTSGKGACTSGKRTCTGGVNSSCMGQVLPSLETCNAKDDNCDGIIDNLDQNTSAIGYYMDAAVYCYGTDLGVCASGQYGCIAGKQGCVSIVPEGGTDEICNNLDDDCNGTVDDVMNLGSSCTVNKKFGECAKGKTDCVAGKDTCTGPAPAVDICDGKDNNCDGITDGCLNMGCPCGP